MSLVANAKQPRRMVRIGRSQLVCLKMRVGVKDRLLSADDGDNHANSRKSTRLLLGTGHADNKGILATKIRFSSVRESRAHEGHLTKFRWRYYADRGVPYVAKADAT